MKILLILLAGVAGLFVIAYAVGMMIPTGHQASRTVRLAQTPEAVWQLLADLPGYPKWAPEVKGVERLPDQNGHPVWAMKGEWAMPLEIESVEPPRRMVTRIADPKLPFGGTWTWEITPEENGTRVTVTEDGVIKPPLFRVMSRFIFGYTSTMDSYLEAMGTRFGETVEPADRPTGVS